MKKSIIIVSIIVLVIVCIGIVLLNIKSENNRNLIINYPVIEDDSVSYKDRIFDTNYMHLVNIIISDSDWKDLINNPLNKTKYKVDVEIDGIKFNDVSFKTKGNSSLEKIANGPKGGLASNRYSFKINFSKYNKEQSYFGLDKLNLNNIYGDATYLNDFMSYEIFRKVGINAPLDSFVFVKINGKDFGLYLAVEEIEDSFMERNNLEGILYKPEQEAGMDNGASLMYKGEDISNYSNIIDNAQNTSTKEDQYRLIDSIRKLNNNENLENVVDIDEVIRYFVAHNYVLSYDSYTGGSIHNYYLLENNGKLSIIPWDYNLAFGKYSMSEDATFIVNFGIDAPLYKAKEEERPLWYFIVNNEEYLNRYHEIMNDLIVNYFESGEYDKQIDKTYNLISYYIENDPSAFYSFDEVNQAVKTLKEFCSYRTKSIRLQLDGKLNTNTRYQDNNDKVDASNIKMSDLGLIASDEK